MPARRSSVYVHTTFFSRLTPFHAIMPSAPSLTTATPVGLRYRRLPVLDLAGLNFALRNSGKPETDVVEAVRRSMPGPVAHRTGRRGGVPGTAAMHSPRGSVRLRQHLLAPLIHVSVDVVQTERIWTLLTHRMRTAFAVLVEPRILWQVLITITKMVFRLRTSRASPRPLHIRRNVIAIPAQDLHRRLATTCPWARWRTSCRVRW